MQTYRMFSSAAKAKSSNFGYIPNNVLNFKPKFGLLVYKGGFNNYAKVKLAHSVLTLVSVYSLVQAYRKNRKFRGLLLWTPATLFCLFIMRTKIMRFKYIHALSLQ